MSFISLIERKYLSDSQELRPMDLAMTAQYFTADVISELAFGNSFGNCDADKDVNGYVGAIEDTIPRAPVLSMMPSMTKYLMKWPLRRFVYAEHQGLGPVVRCVPFLLFLPHSPSKKKKKKRMLTIITHPPASPAKS